MKISTMNAVFVFLTICFGRFYLSSATSHGKGKTSKTPNPFSGLTKPRFISFDSEEGDIDISFDLSIPFITIPWQQKIGENGRLPSLLNVNTKGLTIAGLVTGISALVVPFFSKPTSTSSHSHYRDIGGDDTMEWSKVGNAINEMIFSNEYVAPCMQRIVCSVVSTASRSNNPTSTGKIIDGLSSHGWFREATNGTLIQDAVTIGRDSNRDCTQVYKDCLITPRVLKNIMSQVGVI
ncbi:hypothetical protein KPH14_009587 [Odynerus spinipes]|uniref:Uncharacterized protein n=1 Tax=Odynerus spinipes TaxID=1348599 RepID=A0AAD9VRQ7_9HYME|nr:hypothetical protein KPH14_009587 [Odynerus spinipes]